jgi:hypothetical protein
VVWALLDQKLGQLANCFIALQGDGGNTERRAETTRSYGRHEAARWDRQHSSPSPSFEISDNYRPVANKTFVFRLQQAARKEGQQALKTKNTKS